MEFFNFWDAETFHVFQWVTNNKALNIDSMIEAAYASVKPDEDLVIDDVCEAVRGHLAESLQELAEEQFFALSEDGLDMWGIAQVPDGSVDSLLLPILAHGMRNVDYTVVAQALLVRAGKWNPDTTTPDVE